MDELSVIDLETILTVTLIHFPTYLTVSINKRLLDHNVDLKAFDVTTRNSSSFTDTSLSVMFSPNALSIALPV